MKYVYFKNKVSENIFRKILGKYIIKILYSVNMFTKNSLRREKTLSRSTFSFLRDPLHRRYVYINKKTFSSQCLKCSKLVMSMTEFGILS